MGVIDTRTKEARILLEVALQFGSTLDLDGLLKLVIERLAELMDAERALCALFDDDGQVGKAVLHNMEWPGPGSRLPVSQGVIARAVATRAPVLVSDAFEDEQLQTHASILIFRLRLIAAAPIVSQGRVVGVLYADSQLRGLASVGEKRDLMDALSRLVGTAVENTRLFDEQRYRAQLLAQFVHDFRSPLAVIMTNAGLLADALEDGGGLRAMSTDVLASTRRMLRMIDSTLELARADVGAAAPRPERIDIVAAVRAQVGPLEIVARQVKLAIEVRAPAALPSVETVPDRLGVVIDNLVFNAFKHAAPRSTVTVELALRDDAGPAHPQRASALSPSLFRRVPPLVPQPDSPFVEVSVHNEGAPIPESVQGAMFTPFVRAESAVRGYKSTGLGLSIVEQCVQNFGGRVWIRSTEGEGTRVSFTVPARLSE
jgi:signal transduction histidine kinase